MALIRNHEVGLVALGLVAALALAPTSGFLWALATTIAFVSIWQRVTLHQPTRVSIDDVSVTFEAGKRRHTYAWRDVRECRVRRFLVRDRVFVRIVPAPTFRGRYWITDSVDGYEALVHVLENRGADLRAR